MDTFSKHYTHCLSFNECTVVSNNVVSACEEAHSAHDEISEMVVQDEGRKERTVPKLHSCHEAKVCLCLFTDTQHVPGLFQISSSPVFSMSSWSLSFPDHLLFLVSGFDFLVLVLYGICWAHSQRMKSVLNVSIGLLHRRCFTSVLMSLGWPSFLQQWWQIWLHGVKS